MFSMMICGILMNNISLFAPFYFYSIMGIIWYISWLWLVFEKPSLHTCIEPKELIMIEKSLGGSQQNYTNPTLRTTPWKEFFTSLPCYAIFVANFCRSWNFYLLVLFQASYFKEAFGTTTAEVLFRTYFSMRKTFFFSLERFSWSPTSLPHDLSGTCRRDNGGSAT